MLNGFQPALVFFGAEAARRVVGHHPLMMYGGRPQSLGGGDGSLRQRRHPPNVRELCGGCVCIDIKISEVTAHEGPPSALLAIVRTAPDVECSAWAGRPRVRRAWRAPEQLILTGATVLRLPRAAPPNMRRGCATEPGGCRAGCGAAAGAAAGWLGGHRSMDKREGGQARVVRSVRRLQLSPERAQQIDYQRTHTSDVCLLYGRRLATIYRECGADVATRACTCVRSVCVRSLTALGMCGFPLDLRSAGALVCGNQRGVNVARGGERQPRGENTSRRLRNVRDGRHDNFVITGAVLWCVWPCGRATKAHWCRQKALRPQGIRESFELMWVREGSVKRNPTNHSSCCSGRRRRPPRLTLSLVPCRLARSPSRSRSCGTAAMTGSGAATAAAADAIALTHFLAMRLGSPLLRR